MTKFLRILGSACALRAACAVAVLAATAGCGQRGPLYLPNDPAAAGRATLPEIIVPLGGPSIPTPQTSTLPTQPDPQPPTGGTGTGTAAPVSP